MFERHNVYRLDATTKRPVLVVIVDAKDAVRAVLMVKGLLPPSDRRTFARPASAR